MTASTAPGRQERRKAATRAKIVDAAETLFCDGGDATVEQIADRADVAVATVYTHFSGKPELQRAVVERALEENEQHMMTAYDADAPPLDRLLDAAAAYLRWFRQSPQRFRLLQLRLSGPISDPSDEVLTKRVNLMTDALAGVIADGVADGSLREVPPLDSARFFWGALNGVFALAIRPDSLRLADDELDAAIAAGASLLFEGLVADKHRGSDGRLLPEVSERVARLGATSKN